MIKIIIFWLINFFIIINSIFSCAADNLIDNPIHKPIDQSILAQEQVFHRGNGDEMDSLDPAKVTGVPASNVIDDLYEGLMTYEQSGKLITGQAESYTISADLKTYTFKLRPNLKWSNGKKLDADDFVVGMRRTVDPVTASVYSDILKPIKNADKIIAGKLSAKALGVSAPDERTVVIQLERPTPYLLQLLTHATTFPIYQPNLKKFGDNFTKPGNLVSNGPFKLEDWVVHSHLTVVKNNFYRDADKVILNKVIFYPISEQSVELNRYRAGDLDFTNVIPDVQFDWIKNNLANELNISPQLASYYFGFNLEQPPFKNNRNLRKAISFAIDKKIIAEKVLKSGQVATDYFVPNQINNYSDIAHRNIKITPTIDNPDRQKLAQEFYKQAGFSKENPAKIRITYNTQESHKNISVAIAAMLKKSLGINTELVNQEWKVFLRTRQERKETQLFREGWVGDYNDPSTFLDLYVSNNPQNHSGYNNPEYDNLINQASLQADLVKRSELLLKAEELLLDDAPIIPLYTYVGRHLVKPKVGGFEKNILDKTYDRYIYIKKV